MAYMCCNLLIWMLMINISQGLAKRALEMQVVRVESQNKMPLNEEDYEVLYNRYGDKIIRRINEPIIENMQIERPFYRVS